MSDHITLEMVDVDGAIQETAEAVGADTRADFFKKAALGGGALIGGGVLLSGFPMMAGAATKKSAKNDVKILNFALTLEYLEAAFYKQALANNILAGDVLSTAQIVSNHENTHVTTLKKVLGRAAVKSPTFDFADTVKDASKFALTAIALEDTGVAAYSGQGGNIFTPAVLKAAVSILTVEARHASRFRSLNGENFAPASFDKAKSQKAVLAAVKKTGFIVS